MSGKRFTVPPGITFNDAQAYLEKFRTSDNLANIAGSIIQALSKSYVLSETIEDPNKIQIVWSVEDLEQRATELEDLGDVRYDRTKFQDALHDMKHNHDASIGISWDTIDYYLYDYCRLPEEEEEVAEVPDPRTYNAGEDPMVTATFDTADHKPEKAKKAKKGKK